jgi:integrase
LVHSASDKPKTKAGNRDITLPDIVVEALREHRRQQLELRLRLGLGRLLDDDLLFSTHDGGPIAPRIFSVYWGRAAASIGMPDITFHALRHTHVSMLIAKGVDLVTISTRLGHERFACFFELNQPRTKWILLPFCYHFRSASA